MTAVPRSGTTGPLDAFTLARLLEEARSERDALAAALDLTYDEMMWLEQAARFGARDSKFTGAAAQLDDLSRRLGRAAHVLRNGGQA